MRSRWRSPTKVMALCWFAVTAIIATGMRSDDVGDNVTTALRAWQ